MSITIYSTTSNHEPASEEVKCSSCEEYGYDSSCYYCKGEGVYSQPLCPDINMSNTNALTILQIVLGHSADYCGEISFSDIPVAIRNCMKAINSERVLADNNRLTVQEHNFYDAGIDSDYIKSRLNQVLNILKYAQTHNENVIWG